MKNLNVKAFVYVLLGISAAVWFLYALLTGLDLSKFLDFIRPLPTVAAVDLLVFALFARWGWRWPIFRTWLVPFPDLNGTWRGSIQTTWKGADGQTPGPIPVILTVRQSFLRVSCVMRTAEMTSYSFAEEFRLDPERQIKQMVYSYTSKPGPSVRDRSAPHDGTMVFEIVGNPATKLCGDYWTSRKTTGTVTLDFWCPELKDIFPADLPPHPMATIAKQGP